MCTNKEAKKHNGSDNEITKIDSIGKGSAKTSSELFQKGSVGHSLPAKESIHDIRSLRSELDSKIPGRDYAEFVISTAKRTVKQEDPLVRQIFYTAIGKDSADQINLAVLAPASVMMNGRTCEANT
jgi:hypothetical protein